MYNEIDLHQMNFDDALRVFITKYNSLYKKGERREIMVIHGYGSKFLDSTPVIRTKIREYFLRNKECVKMRLDMNKLLLLLSFGIINLHLYFTLVGRQ